MRPKPFRFLSLALKQFSTFAKNSPPSLAVLFTACCLLSAPWVQASQTVILPAAPLNEQLRQLSRQFGVAILFKPNDIKSLQGKALKAQLSLDDALTALLAEQSLAFHRSNIGIVIKPKPIAPAEPRYVPPAISEVIVTSYAQELNNALQLKHAHNGVSDGIVASDIARFPNLNLAEALQRISGVNITREGGEGRQIALRGLSPSFALVRLNGLDVLGNSDSPMDSRGQKTRDRAFDFNIFAAELFSAVQVSKTYDASQSEGGIAGTVDLYTPKPFDYSAHRAALSYKLGYNDLSHGHDNRVSGIVSRRYQRWGYLASIASSQRATQEQGANTTRWRQTEPFGADISALPEPIQARWQNSEIHHPRGNRYSVWQSDQQRLGLTQALQFQDEDLNFSIEWLYSKLSNDRAENHLYLRGASSTPIIPNKTVVNAADINDKDMLIFADYSHAQMATESRIQHVTTEFNHLGISLTHAITDSVTWVLNGATEFADLDMPSSAKAYTEGVADVSVDYRQDPFYADIHYRTDTTDAANWYLHEIDIEKYFVENEYHNLDNRWIWQSSTRGEWQLGWQFKRFGNQYQLGNARNLLRDEWQAFQEGTPEGEQNTNGIIAVNNRLSIDTVSHFTEHQRAHWIALDTAALVRQYVAGPVYFEDFDHISRIEEDTHSLFISQSNTYWLLQKPLRLEWAWRLSQTHAKIINQQPVIGPNTSNRYQYWLPSMTATWDLTPDLLLKLAFSKNVSRPRLDDMANGYRVDEAGQRVLAPNHSLRPYSASNYDAAIEWYFGLNSFLSVNLFYKSLKDYIVTTQSRLTANQPLPNAIADQLSSLEDIYLIRPTNAEQARIHGVEFGLSTPLMILPFGLKDIQLNANATFFDGEAAVYSNDGQKLFTKALPSLSPFSYTLSLSYEKNRWGARLSSTYRDSYISQINTNVLNEEDERGFHETLHIDASAYLQLSQPLRLSFEALNISNEREEQYSSSADRAYNTTQHGRSFFLGVELQW